jgi:hypothetical protein
MSLASSGARKYCRHMALDPSINIRHGKIISAIWMGGEVIFVITK